MKATSHADDEGNDLVTITFTKSDLRAFRKMLREDVGYTTAEASRVSAEDFATVVIDAWESLEQDLEQALYLTFLDADLDLGDPA